jgi:hypothetical protein
MARIRTERPAPSARRRAAFAFASLFVVVLAVATTASWRRSEEARLAAARAEQHRIEQELHQIKEITAGLQPAVYVGSNQEYDYYIDLRTLEEGATLAQPASYREPSRPGI